MSELDLNKVYNIASDIGDEFVRSVKVHKFPYFNSYHEGYAVIKEELDELWEEVKIHPTQKSIKLLRRLIEIFTDPGDVVIDPVAGSGVTLLAANQLGRKSYGFEIKKEYVDKFYSKLAVNIQTTIFQKPVPIKRLGQEVLDFTGAENG